TPEGGVAVEPDPPGEEVAIAELEHVLKEESGVDHAQARLARDEDRGVADDQRARRREALPISGRAHFIGGDALPAERKRGAEPLGELEVQVADVVRREDRGAHLTFATTALRRCATAD